MPKEGAVPIDEKEVLLTIPILVFIVMGLGIGVCLTKLDKHRHASTIGLVATLIGAALGVMTLIGPFWPPFLGFVASFAYFGVHSLIDLMRRRRATRGPTPN